MKRKQRRRKFPPAKQHSKGRYTVKEREGIRVMTLQEQYSVLLLAEPNIKDTLYSRNRGTDSWADSISSLANLITMRALCKDPGGSRY